MSSTAEAVGNVYLEWNFAIEAIGFLPRHFVMTCISLLFLPVHLLFDLAITGMVPIKAYFQLISGTGNRAINSY